MVVWSAQGHLDQSGEHCTQSALLKIKSRLGYPASSPHALAENVIGPSSKPCFLVDCSNSSPYKWVCQSGPREPSPCTLILYKPTNISCLKLYYSRATKISHAEYILVLYISFTEKRWSDMVVVEVYTIIHHSNIYSTCMWYWHYLCVCCRLPFVMASHSLYSNV